MASAPQLLGPPFLHRSSPLNGGFHSQLPPPFPTLTSQQNPCLDLFYDTLKQPNLIIPLLTKAWKHDPLATLKLLFIHRSITGKSCDKDTFFTGLLWLHKNHPLTLACNIQVLANLGSLKDLIEILHKILFDESPELDKIKKGRDVVMGRRVVEKFKNDKDYRFLHNRISELFADHLKSDIQFLELGEIEKISLASKFCPSLDSSYDKSTLMCEAIGRLLFPRGVYVEYNGMEEAHYAFRVRDRLRKQVLIPLRKSLDNGGDLEAKLREKRVVKDLFGDKTFRAYQNMYHKLVLKNGYYVKDDEKFRLLVEFASSVNEGNVSYFTNHIVDFFKHGVVEFQWHKLVEDLSKKEEWSNCLAISIVSESSKGTRLWDFSVSMGLLLSELNREKPWKGRVFAGAQNPKLVEIEGENFQSKVSFVKKLESGGGQIRFSKVFDEVLEVAKANNVSADKMVKRIFVFSDVGIEIAANNFFGVWATEAKYRNHGYNVLPEIVFWDLSGAVIRPVINRGKVLMLKGLSNSFVSMLLNKGEKLLSKESESLVFPKAEDLMNVAISVEELKGLCVLD